MLDITSGNIVAIAVNFRRGPGGHLYVRKVSKLCDDVRLLKSRDLKTEPETRGLKSKFFSKIEQNIQVYSLYFDPDSTI